MDQGKKAASLSTTRLSPLAKPFTLNRSTHQPTSSSSVLSAQQPSVRSLGHCNDDPFSSLLDTFRKSNLGSKVETVPVETALPVEASAQSQEKSLLEQYPSPEFQENGDFDVRHWSHFEKLEEFSMPTYSSSVSGLGYGTGINGNGVSCTMDFHESLFGKGNDVGSSVGHGSMLEKGKHAVDGLNPCLALSDGIFTRSTTRIGEKDILSNSKGTIHAADESSSFILSNYKVAPLKLSTDTSSFKNIPQDQSSMNLGGDSDSDVDSPCWKGTMACSLTPSETLGSVQFHHVEKATEKHNSLNPLAPQFFPGIGSIKDDFVSSNSGVPLATNLSSGEDLLMKTIVPESPLELNKGIKLQHSTNICGREKAFNMLNDPKSSSVDPLLNPHCMMAQSSSKVDCSTSKVKLATVVDVDGFIKGTKDSRASGSKDGVFPAKGHSPTPTSTSTSSSSGVVTDLFNTLKGFSKSLIESPNPDVHTMVSAMHVLSELLVQTCVDRVDSYNETDCDIVVQIINNLNVFSTKRFEQRIPTLDSTYADSPYCLDRSSELPEGLEVTSIETLPVPNLLYVQNNYMGKNSVSKVVAESGQISSESSSHQGTEKGNEFAQVIRRSLGKSLDFEKLMRPEALLFWNLWLDSEAERCYRKFKTFHCLMEAGMDLNSANVAELLR